MHATFALENNELRWETTDGRDLGLPAPSAEYDPGVVVDRIVILGLADPAAWQARAGDRAVEAEPGPVRVVTAVETPALVLRKVALPIKGSWTVTLERRSTASS